MVVVPQKLTLSNEGDEGMDSNSDRREEDCVHGKGKSLSPMGGGEKIGSLWKNQWKLLKELLFDLYSTFSRI